MPIATISDPQFNQYLFLELVCEKLLVAILHLRLAKMKKVYQELFIKDDTQINNLEFTQGGVDIELGRR